jgi:hypothetical protein
MGIRLAPLTEDWQKALGKEIAGAIGESAQDISSRIFGDESLSTIVEDFQKHFAKPMMQTWQSEIAPIIKEGYNLPGVAYSTGASRGLAKAGEEFMTTKLSPALFEAIQNYYGREVQRAGMGAGLVSTGASLATAQTIQPFYKSKNKKSLGGVVGAAAGIGLGALFPGAGKFLGGSGPALTTMEMGQLGGLFGGAF